MFLQASQRCLDTHACSHRLCCIGIAFGFSALEGSLVSEAFSAIGVALIKIYAHIEHRMQASHREITRTHQSTRLCISYRHVCVALSSLSVSQTTYRSNGAVCSVVDESLAC